MALPEAGRDGGETPPPRRCVAYLSGDRLAHNRIGPANPWGPHGRGLPWVRAPRKWLGEGMRILIVEDSPTLADALYASLAREGYACDHAGDGVSAAAYTAQYDYDILVLDWMLPRREGIDILRELRERGAQTRVLMLSARDQVVDRVMALDAGADDYLVKPFALDELLARLRALARRPREGGETRLALGELELELRSRRASWRGQDLHFTPKEYALMALLLRERGHLLTRAQIFDRLYDSQSEASDKVVEVILSTLRGKLAKAGAPDVIETRRGFGYVIP
ncbi:response regulator transcription factor [Pseudoxanthomonas mexicana]|mgnify:CR=1 FL=1|nr:response regulator transcription factor [Pseudoxanthomonas mexicana]